MPRTAYKLTPKSGLHLGREGLAQETSAESFPSDSFFAALVATIATCYGSDAATQFCDQWSADETGDTRSTPPYTFTSLFPCVGQICLIPLPRMRIHFEDQETYRAKRLKKLQYVSPKIATCILTGNAMDDWLPAAENTHVKNGLMLQGGRVWVSTDELTQLPEAWHKQSHHDLFETSIWQNGSVPRVTVDRINSSSVIYQMGRTVFDHDCGLWFMLDYNDEDDLQEFEHYLSLLADTGIGGERTAGYGAFEYQTLEKQKPDLPFGKNAPYLMTLSRYSPTQADLEGGVLSDNASYELVDVGGWLNTIGAAAQRRKRVRLIEAGSVLRNKGKITGRIVDVAPDYDNSGAPDHAVYRSGIPFLIQAKGVKDDDA